MFILYLHTDCEAIINILKYQILAYDIYNQPQYMKIHILHRVCMKKERAKTPQKRTFKVPF
jgi:hypothetical protein